MSALAPLARDQYIQLLLGLGLFIPLTHIFSKVILRSFYFPLIDNSCYILVLYFIRLSVHRTSIAVVCTLTNTGSL